VGNDPNLERTPSSRGGGSLSICQAETRATTAVGQSHRYFSA